MNWKRMLIVAAGALALFWPGVAQAQNCNDRIRREERELDSAIRRHGYYSRQAQEERRELDNLRYSCGGDYRYNGNYGNYGYYGNDRRFDRDDRNWRDRERRERERRFRNELREERREHRRHRERDHDRDWDRDGDRRR